MFNLSLVCNTVSALSEGWLSEVPRFSLSWESLPSRTGEVPPHYLSLVVAFGGGLLAA